MNCGNRDKKFEYLTDREDELPKEGRGEKFFM
jgi:hypothetical protein